MSNLSLKNFLGYKLKMTKTTFNCSYFILSCAASKSVHLHKYLRRNHQLQNYFARWSGSLRVFQRSRTSPRVSWELVTPEKQSCPSNLASHAQRYTRIILSSRLSSKALQAEILLASNLRQDIWLRRFFLFSFFFLYKFLSKSSCLPEILARNSAAFHGVPDPEFPLESTVNHGQLVCPGEIRRLVKNARRKTRSLFLVHREYRSIKRACVARETRNPSMNIPAGFLWKKIVAGRCKPRPVLRARFPRAVRTTIPWSVRSSRA